MRAPGIKMAAVLLAASWVVALVLAHAGFWQTYGTLPSFDEAVIGAVALGAFAMPLSLAQTLGASVGPGAAMPLAVIYWAVLAYLHYTAARHALALAAAVLVVVASGWRWQINAQGLLGL